MALNASKMESKSKFKRQTLEEPGTYPARLVQILSLGLQPQRPYKGEEKEPQQELMVTYELLDEFMKDDETGEDILDKPRWISETFPMHSLEADLAKSTKRYYALDPDKTHKGDWGQLAGAPAMVTITLNPSKKDPEKIYENITGVSTMRAKEAGKAPELVNPPKVFDIDEPDMEVFGSLPQWIQDKMKENLEFAGSALEKALEGLPKEKEREEKNEDKEPETVKEEGDDGDDW